MSNVRVQKKVIEQVLHRLVDVYMSDMDDGESDAEIESMPIHERIMDFGTYLQNVDTFTPRELWLLIHGTQSARPVLRYIGLSDDEWAVVVENVQNMNELDYEAVEHMSPEDEAEQTLLRCVEVNQIVDRINQKR